MANAVNNAIRSVSVALLAAGGVTKLYRMRIGGVPLLRVLNFHDVPDAHRFGNILMFLTTHYHVVTPGECFSTLDPKRINVLLTFDDGYASWISVALPLLSSLNIRAIFFVNSGLLDVHADRTARARYVSDRLLVSARDTLSWSGLRALRLAGHMIGGHTTSHSRLSNLREHELWAQVADDKRRIESMLDTAITSFAYPFGEHAAHAEAFLRDVGYKQAFYNEPRFATADNPLRIPRFPVDEAKSIAALKYAIEGSGDVYEYIKASLRKSRTNTQDAV